jgi:mRNA-degrading endonuclease YafQ of YafQ-DinJ toxin-antitoxin module
MIITKIKYALGYIKRIKKLPVGIKVVAIAKEKLFRSNPLHPSLRLHELHGKFRGLWSISLTVGYRIIFERQNNGEILFISIGKHDIYKHL